MVQLDILSTNKSIYKHNNKNTRFQHNNENICIKWECNEELKKQTCSIQKYIVPDNDRALGFHTLFPIELVKKAKGIIKVTCCITADDKYKEPTNDEYRYGFTTKNYAQNGYKKSIKSRPPKNEAPPNTNTAPPNTTPTKNGTPYSKTPPNTNTAPPNTNIKKRNIRKITLDDYPGWKRHKTNNVNQEIVRKTSWKFSDNTINTIIWQISDKLGHTNDSFGFIPTIDCFSFSDKYAQTLCKQRILNDEDFFWTSKYEKSSYWASHIAWCNPPKERKMIVDCINIFRSRKIKGYICIPNWDGANWNRSKWLLDAKKMCKTYIKIKYSIILYFNYQI